MRNAARAGGGRAEELSLNTQIQKSAQADRKAWLKNAIGCGLWQEINRFQKSRQLCIDSRRLHDQAGAQGCGKGGAWPVCDKTAGMSTQGLCDMIGNLWEWTLDEYRPHYDQTHQTDLPVCASKTCTDHKGVKRVIRGAGYMTKSSGTTATIRSKSDRAASGIGFRVALKTQMDQ